VVCRNPLLADRRKEKREALLQATERLLESVRKKTQRKRKPLRGKDNIGVEVGKIINKKKVAKHFVVNIKEEDLTYKRNEEKIHSEAALDGLYVIRSSVNKDQMTDEELVMNYKNLEMVERAFRSLKSIDLNVRPIYHRLENRVRAHIFICMLAYYVEHAMRRMLAPLLFIDEEKESVKTRESVVLPVRRSASAKRKDQSRKTKDGRFAIASFRDIIKSLSAITSSTIHIKGHKAGSFKTTSKPSKYQYEILKLLDVHRQV
jgi:transposase